MQYAVDPMRTILWFVFVFYGQDALTSNMINFCYS